MNSTTAAKTFLPCSILLLALTFCSSVITSCIGFCPAVQSNTARSHQSHAAVGWSWSIIPPSTRSSSSRQRQRARSALFGYANINDYFATFNSTIGNIGANKKKTELSKSNSTAGNTSTSKKYIGHGQIMNDGTQNEGGLFNVNNYFTSLNNKNNSDGEKSSPTTTDDDDDDANITKNTVPSQPNGKQTSQTNMKKMTYQEIIASKNARLCPKLLLTQRAIQSFVYLLEECRDPHSGKVWSRSI